MGIPVIDPLIGHSVNSTSLLLRAKMLVNKNHATCPFWQTLRDSTPPSSLDLEWEHEGLQISFPWSIPLSPMELSTAAKIIQLSGSLLGLFYYSSTKIRIIQVVATQFTHISETQLD